MVHVEDNSVSFDGQPFLPQLPDVRIIEGKPYVSSKNEYVILEDVLHINLVLCIWKGSAVYMMCAKLHNVEYLPVLTSKITF
jgi:hypothetical protein